MPLFKGKSKKIISKNISELVTTKPSSARAKGIATLARRRGITKKQAAQKQAVAIALNKADKKK